MNLAYIPKLCRSYAKIIVVTGYHDYKIDENDVAAIFYKPYEIDEIMAAIKKILMIDN